MSDINELLRRLEGSDNDMYEWAARELRAQADIIAVLGGIIGQRTLKMLAERDSAIKMIDERDATIADWEANFGLSVRVEDEERADFKATIEHLKELLADTAIDCTCPIGKHDECCAHCQLLAEGD